MNSGPTRSPLIDILINCIIKMASRYFIEMTPPPSSTKKKKIRPTIHLNLYKYARTECYKSYLGTNDAQG